MVYTGAELHFWLDGVGEDHAANDSGDLTAVDNPLFVSSLPTSCLLACCMLLAACSLQLLLLLARRFVPAASTAAFCHIF